VCACVQSQRVTASANQVSSCAQSQDDIRIAADPALRSTTNNLGIRWSLHD